VLKNNVATAIKAACSPLVSADGRFSCSFSRPISIIKQSLTINLDGGQPFYVLLARGSGGKGNPSYHSARKHTQTAIEFSGDMENEFHGGVPMSGPDPAVLIKTHAVFLFMAWGMFVPLG